MPTLRQAAKDDIMLIHELALQAFPATYRDLLSQEQMDFMMDWMYSPANLEKQMEEGHVYFIASHQGEDCGYLSVQPEGPGVFHLQKIYVLPGFQGLHIGSYLFRQAVSYIRSIHPEPCLMRLNVNRYNTRAVEFYRAHGDAGTGTRGFPHRPRLLHDGLHHGAGYCLKRFSHGNGAAGLPRTGSAQPVETEQAGQPRKQPEKAAPGRELPS